MKREERPATIAEVEAEYAKFADQRLREFIDQIGPDDVLTYRRWNDLAPLAGSAGYGYQCVKPDGTKVWVCLQFVMA